MIVLVIFAMMLAVVSAAEIVEPVIPGTSDVLSDGSDPGDPFEVLSDTTAEIYIYVTLRTPEGPPPDSFEIQALSGGTGGGDTWIQLKSTSEPGPENIHGDYYIVYRADWPLFTWDDVRMFGTGLTPLMPYTSIDSLRMILPIEQPSIPDTHLYRWQWSQTTTRDMFLDTLWDDVDWNDVYGTHGVFDPRLNWFYTLIGADSSSESGITVFSPTVARPCAEFDVTLYQGDNYVSYAVNHLGISTFLEMAEEMDTIDGIPAAEALYRWNASTQTWIEVSYIFVFGSTSFWTGDGPLIPGQTFRVAKTDPDSVIFTMATPGTVPKIEDYGPYNLTPGPTGSVSGDNYIMMPHEEYTFLLRTYWEAESSRIVKSKYLLQDILVSTSILKWNGNTQTWVEIAYWFIFGSTEIPQGEEEIFPGRTYRIVVDGEETWPPIGG